MLGRFCKEILKVQIPKFLEDIVYILRNFTHVIPPIAVRQALEFGISLF